MVAYIMPINLFKSPFMNIVMKKMVIHSVLTSLIDASS
jgi:hypothetical protein